MTKNLWLRPGSFLFVGVNLVMLSWLIGCSGPEKDSARPAVTSDIYGTWTASGLAFESAGQGSTPLTKAQVSLFDTFNAASFTFHRDGTYVKRSLDSTVSPTSVLTTLGAGHVYVTERATHFNDPRHAD